jgi:prevent-host-death family protein
VYRKRVKIVDATRVSILTLRPGPGSIGVILVKWFYIIFFEEATVAERVSVVEAKRTFSELLRRVGEGERFIITSHGRPVAEIGPTRHPTLEEQRQAVENILEARKGRTLGGLNVKDLVNEGRKW